MRLDDLTALGHNTGVLRIKTTTSTFDILYNNSGVGLDGFEFGFAGTTYSMAGSPTLLSDGNWHVVQVLVKQNGANASWRLWVDGVDQGVTADLSGMTVGTINTIQTSIASFAGNGPIIDNTQVHVGYVAVASPITSLTPANASSIGSAVTGYTGETPGDRLIRIGAEENIQVVVHGTTTALMGPQPIDTVNAIFRDCETVDGGVLIDGENFGVALYPISGRYNPNPAITPTLNQLDPPFEPVESSQRVRNDITVYRPNGSSARYVQPAGQPYSPTGPGGVGAYGPPVTMNVSTDGVLAGRAQWLVRVGTADADRYPTLAVNLAARTALIESWLNSALGARVTVPTTYSTGGLPPDVLIEGWSEQLSTFVWQVGWNTAPVDPWFVGVTDDANYAWLDADATTLTGTWDGVTTGAVLTITTTAGPLWSTSAADYPVDINVNGQRVTVSACSGASNPQTLTVSVASVNGISESHGVTTPVAPWFPFVLSI
jgi:hypothetical protein